LNRLNKNRIQVQIVWYLLGVSLPALTLLARSPIYTRIYSPETYGYYTLIYITYAYISSFLFQWITSGSWRYFLKYDKKGELSIYSRIISNLYFISGILLFLISLTWCLVTRDSFAQEMITYGFVYALTNELLNTLLVPMRIKDKAKQYNLIIALKAILSFVLLIYLTFQLQFGIVSFFIAPTVFNLLLIGALLIFTKRKKAHKPKTYRLHLYRFLKYGISTLLFNTGIFLLISSDRYLINFFSGHSDVGIYNQTYNIAQLSIAALFTAINAAFNPKLINSLTTNPSGSNNTLNNSFYLALYISLPFVVIFSVFSKEIAILLLGPEFRILWSYLPFIFFSAFLFGLSHFATIKLKFQNKLRVLALSTVYSAILNIILNLILIPLFDYKVAAITTFISYLFLIGFVFRSAEINPFLNKKILRNSFLILGCLGLIYLLHVLFSYYLNISLNNILIAIIEGIIMVSLFFVITKRISPFRNENIKIDQ
jgi:O-antigen/teichoic acid export membrane protein